jgi:CubicO group peptidase (beta-lactamase class C family)
VGWADRERRIRATSDTVFQLASVSKTLTSDGIMALVEDGVIDLDTDINTYLPFEVHIPHAPDAPITMRNLLTHTSAIRDRWQVWGTPWSEPTLYFHGDSPILLGDFCRSYFVHGGTRYRRRKNFYERAPGSDTRTRTWRSRWQGSWQRRPAAPISTSCAGNGSSHRWG